MPNSTNRSSVIKQAASTLHDGNRALLRGRETISKRHFDFESTIIKDDF
ncbi:hypothetical protein BN59_02535 [Legionella massiliensis]|uniref:Uncharacterized protein n=1 Tax=Legionella massiliensis TaxID=1034943 RepID=A0A078KYT6_9GAMM|nr:hypothetical protein [Legionella massiliensis]CDZ78227.1 hypothetical protein BN59_02535 [Legionella massiliensis]CEE13965.1 hypothetical protein BN1094_02535 [Legionella massiliensis]